MGIKSIFERALHREILSRVNKDGYTISVVQKGRGKDSVRTLLYNDTIFSTIRSSTIYTKSYWDYFLPLPSMFKSPRVLVLGLGGGTVPFQMRQLYGERIGIDAVEIDRDMVRLSKVFLGGKVDANIIIGDALSYVKETGKTYDVIVMDVYVGDSIPKKFLDMEFIEGCKSILGSDGVFATNFALSLTGSFQLFPFKSNIERVFGRVYSVKPLYVPGNNILVALKGIKAEQAFSLIKDNFPENSENRFLIDAYSEALK